MNNNSNDSVKNVASSISVEQAEEWSEKFRNWHYYPEHVIPAVPEIEGVENVHMTDVPTVFQLPDDPLYYMSFLGYDGRGYQSFIVDSEDLVNWRNIRLAMSYGPEGEFDFGGRVIGAYQYEDYDLKAPRILKKRDGLYYSLYLAFPSQGGYELPPGSQGIAASSDGIAWKRVKEDPILSVFDEKCGDWEKDCIFLPWLVEHDGRFYNFYNAAKGKFEQMGLATSQDLYQWNRYTGNPILSNGEDGSFHEVFCSDAKVFWDEDHWSMFFFGVGRGGAHIMMAYSRDLEHWTIDPEPLYKSGGHPAGLDSQYAHKISIVWNPSNETFYMYYNAVGEKGRGIGLLTSKPL
ncbi:hypothetical protein QEH56_07735 [Pelagicoccus enzymogenes]|uniref:hypothetical protein n=1 Tax=Pelagicoccus enzymogenes TaxID=2773457 RepID=UPI00280F1280|nr:hypothetical protein [Pelagicoccus enzymogenes]MDQ8198033.1 hypothetical protein [Pelagicoccus enzymogenes]